MSPVYVISLKWQTALRERLKARLESLGIEHEIVDALDGATIEPSQYAHRLQDQPTAVLRGEGLTRGEIACYLSHYRLWGRIADEGIQHAVILEDDAVLADDFRDIIEALPNLGWYWDIVRMSATQPCKITRVLCPVVRNRILVRYREPVWGAVAYAITLNATKVLRDYCYVMRQPIDMAYEEWWKAGLHFFAVQPPAVRFTTEHSALEEERNATWSRTDFSPRYLAQVRRQERLRSAQRYWWGFLHPPKRIRCP